MGLWGKLVSGIVETGVEMAKMKSSLEAFAAENASVLKKIMSGKEISVSEFLELYDQRTYDIHSKQNDVKFMKELDFEGLYLIKNKSKKRYYLGKGANVFRKVDRHFRGYGNQDIFADYEKKNRFVVCFMRLENSGYETLSDYEKSIIQELRSTDDEKPY